MGRRHRASDHDRPLLDRTAPTSSGSSRPGGGAEPLRRHARDKSLYLSWLAASYLHAGEVEQAATVASRALDLSAEVASARPRQRLDPLIDQLRGHHALPAVADVLEKAKAS